MDQEAGKLFESELTQRVIGAFYDVYNELGVGFLEQAYENAMVLVLRDCGIDLVQQPPVDVLFRGRVVGQYRADLVIPDRLLIEVKAVETLARSHDSQVINYLKATKLPLGLLFNFGPHPQFRRLINRPTQEG